MNRVIALIFVAGIHLIGFGQGTKAEVDSLLATYDNNSSIALDEILSNYNRAYTLSKNDKNVQGQVKALVALSRLSLTKLNNFNKAISYLNKIKKLAGKKNYKLLADYHSNLGSLYFLEGTDHERAFKEFSTAFAICRKHKINPSHKLLSNYALALIAEGKFDEALMNLKKSLEQFNESDENFGETKFPNVVYTNIGVCYIHKKNLDSAEYYLKMARDYAYQRNNTITKFKTTVYLGVFYQETLKDQNAMEMFEIAERSIGQVDGTFEMKALLYEGKSLSLFELNDFRNAYIAKANQEKYEDSLRILGLNEQAFRYDYNVRIDSLQREKRLAQVKASLEQKSLENRIYFYVLIIILIASTGGFIVYRLIKRNQVAKVRAENERLEHLHKMQEAELNILKSEEQAISANIELSAKKNELQELKSLLENHVQSSDDPQFNQLRAFLNRTKSSEKRGEQLRFLDELVSNSNNEFYDRLREVHPNLKKGDRRLAFLIKLSLSTEELMLVFNISKASLYTKRYRLKGKLKLSDSEDLDNYLHTL